MLHSTLRSRLANGAAVSLLAAAVAANGSSHHAATDDAAEDAAGPRSVETLPDHRGGQELVGRAWPDLDFDRRLDCEQQDEMRQDGEVITLYRWWTNGCPYCERSLPAIEKWRERYESQGLRTVAVYHPKPPREVSDRFVRRAADAFGYHGQIAVDTDWSQLRRATRGWRDRRATSVSFLVDQEGVISFVHPGLDYFPSDDPDEQRQNSDHDRLERAIETLLETLPKPAPADDEAD